MTGVAELIRFLRAHPSGHDIGQLATQFGVDKSVVQAAISRVSPDIAQPNLKQARKSLRIQIAETWLGWTSNPLRYLIILGVVTTVVMIAFINLPDGLKATWSESFRAATFSSILFGSPFIQLAGIARTGKYRYVLIGAAITFATLMTAVTVGGMHVKFSGSSSSTSFGMIAVAMFALTLLYLVIGVPFVVIGAYRTVRKEKRAYETMGRQELLERLLEVRAALAVATENSVVHVPKLAFTVEKIEKWTPWIAVFAAFVTSCVMSIIMVSMDPKRAILAQTQESANLQIRSGMLVFTMLLSIVIYATQFGLGLCNKALKGLLWTCAGYMVGYVAAGLMPFAYVPFGENGRFGWGNYGFGVVLQVTMVVVGFLARIVYEHTVMAERRRLNDPVALTDELVELEWRLTPNSGKVCVMAVDVAGSTDMKRSADPLVAEWTFREYQAWVENVCLQFGGKVQSTAGDGAILGFASAVDAVRAGQHLLSLLPDFNAAKNKLDKPFRLRIGLHTGDVQGELGDVQFTRVIDVAAHIEHSAPVNGIALSETVLADIDPSLATRTATAIDGHEVYAIV